MAKEDGGGPHIPDFYTFTRYTGANVNRRTYPINLWVQEAESKGAEAGYKEALRDLQEAGVELPVEFKKRLIEK